MTDEIKKRIAAINSGIVPDGYKKTKVGVVPVEWNDIKFSNIFIEKVHHTNDFIKYPLYSLTIEEGVVPKTERYERSHLVKKDDVFKVVDQDDFVYNPMNVRFGALARYKGNNPVSVSGYYDIFAVRDEYSKEYMENFLLSSPMITYYNRVSTGSLKEKQRVHFSQFLEFELPVPPLPEQQKIAEILSTQDKLIELHEKKIEQLKELKKGYLQKMFPAKGSKYPELRFKGFTDAWEQRKLSDMVERVTRKNENLESELPLTISAQYGLIDQNEFFDKRIASRDVSGYYLLKKGEFAYNKSTSSDAPWGAVKRLDRYEMGVLSTLYIVFALKENGNIDSDFLVSYYDTDCWHKGVQAIAAEGARNHGLLNITPADYFETVLTVSSDVKEQHQIGTFFAKLDSLITLHQRKLEQEKQKKKALMQLLLTGKVRVKI